MGVENPAFGTSRQAVAGMAAVVVVAAAPGSRTSTVRKSDGKLASAGKNQPTTLTGTVDVWPLNVTVLLES
jgi:hypothetical protein